MAESPVHLIANANANDANALCGKGSNRDPATPTVVAAFAPQVMHWHAVCAACLDAQEET